MLVWPSLISFLEIAEGISLELVSHAISVSSYFEAYCENASIFELYQKESRRCTLPASWPASVIILWHPLRRGTGGVC